MWKSIIISALMVLLAGVSVILALAFMSMKEFEDELDTTKISLKQTESKLQLAEINLSETHGRLEDVTVELNDTSVELKTANNRLETMETQLWSERSKNSEMSSDYSELKNSINSRVALTAIDMQGFITPDNSVVSEKVFDIVGDYSEDTNEYWRDCDRLYKWVVNNISYSYDSPMPVLPEFVSGELIWRQDYWRKPEETIEDETGDCEDFCRRIHDVTTPPAPPRHS